jgi:hypothetical protein
MRWLLLALLALAIALSGVTAAAAQRHHSATLSCKHRAAGHKSLARGCHKPRKRRAVAPARRRAASVGSRRHRKGHVDRAITTSAVTPYSVTIRWPLRGDAQTTNISVKGQVVDSFPMTDDTSYTVTQLWPATSYAITVSLESVGAQTVATYSTTVTTSPGTGPFPRLYSDSAFINQPVSASPSLDPNSSAIASEAITRYASGANLVNNADWGIPVVSADAQSSTYDVGCQYYWCEQDFGQLHIPADAEPSSGSDGHMVVLQPNGDELDMWVGQHTSQGWSAGERWVESADGPAANCTVLYQCGGANAANFALGAGLVRPEEIAQGHIDHALAITTPDTRQGYIACPAINGDGTHPSPDALPIGAHVQLDPSINVAKLNVPAWQKVIATALQRYGAYVTDTGGSLGVYAQSNQGRSYDAWAKAGVSAQSPSLAGLPWNKVRILELTKCN